MNLALVSDHKLIDGGRLQTLLATRLAYLVNIISNKFFSSGIHSQQTISAYVVYYPKLDQELTFIQGFTYHNLKTAIQ